MVKMVKFILYMHAKSLSHVQLFVTPWTVAHQASLSMGLSRQEDWSGLPCLSPPILGILHYNKKKSHIQKKLTSFFSLFSCISRCLCCEYRSPQDGGAQPCNFVPLLGHVAMPRGVFSCHNWKQGRMFLVSSGLRPGMLLNASQGTGQPPWQRTIQTQMSREPRVRNPTLREGAKRAKKTKH